MLRALLLLPLFTGCAAPTAPTASAGAIVVGAAGDVFLLDGTSSEGQGLTYSWALTDGPEGAALNDDDAQIAYLTPELDGVYTLTLTVCDRWDRCDDAETLALVGATASRQRLASFGGPGLAAKPFGKNQAPEASASARRSMGMGSTIKLDGSASVDPDGDPLRYRWTFTARPSGSTLTDADIQNSTSALASFTGDVKGTYGVRLTVRDGLASDSVVIPDILLGYVEDSDPLDDLISRPGAALPSEAVQRSSVSAPNTFAGVDSGAGALGGVKEEDLCKTCRDAAKGTSSQWVKFCNTLPDDTPDERKIRGSCQSQNLKASNERNNWCSNYFCD